MAVVATFKLAAAVAFKLPVLVKVQPVSMFRSPAVQLIVLLLFQLRVRVVPAALLSAVVPLVVSRPVPPSVPPFQLKAPLKVMAAGLKMPPFRVKVPSSVEALAIVNPPEPRTSVLLAASEMLFALSIKLMVTVLLTGIMTSSLMPGAKPPSQLVSISQLPVPPLQVKAAPAPMKLMSAIVDE